MAYCSSLGLHSGSGFQLISPFTEIMGGSLAGLRGEWKDQGIEAGGLNCSLNLGLGQPGAFLSSLSPSQFLTDPESLSPHRDRGDK